MLYMTPFALLSGTSCRNVQLKGWPKRSDMYDTYKNAYIGDKKNNYYPKSMSGRQKGFTCVK